jgi:hypothetical protein
LAEAGLIGVFLYIWFWCIIMRDIVLKRFHSIDSFIVATFLVTIFVNTFLGNVFLTAGGGLEVIFFYYLTRRTSVITYNPSFVPAQPQGEDNA